MRVGRGVVAVVAATVSMSTAVGMTAAPAVAGSVATCQGKRATMVVTGVRRHVVGTSRADVIVALGSGDVISGGAGNDVICAGSARSIDGGAGNDRITFSGSPVVHGGAGNDTITQLGAGNPTVYGDAGNDTITLNKGNGKAYGGDGNDILKGGTAGRQLLDGGPGNDRLIGGLSGSFTLRGGDGNDVLQLRGGKGDSADGGSGANLFVIPPALLNGTKVLDHVGDSINGLAVKPSGAPASTGLPVAAVSAAPASLPPPSSAPVVAPTLSAGLTVDGSSAPNISETQGPDDDAEHYVAMTFGVPAGDQLSNWSLSFGDDSVLHSGTHEPPTMLLHVYDEVGRFTSTMTITDVHGATASASVVVDVAAAPVLDLAPAATDGTTALDNESFAGTHAAAGASLTSYEVSWGDGSISSDMTGPPSTIQHTYATPGHYAISVELGDDHGAYVFGHHTFDYNPGGTHVVVSDGFSDAVERGSVIKTSFTLELQVLQSISSVSGSPTFTVNYGDGSAVATVPGTGYFSHEYSSAGQFPVSVTETVGSSSDTARYTADIAGQPSVMFGATGSSFLVGQPVTFVGTATAMNDAMLTTYDVSWGDGTPDQTGTMPLPTSFSHTFSAAGAVEPVLSVVDDHDGEDGYGSDITVTASTVTVALHASSSLGGYDSRWVGANVDSGTLTSDGVDPQLVFASAAVVPVAGHSITTYDLNYGDGTPDFTGTTDHGVIPGLPSHGYKAVGEYELTMTVTQDDGSVATSTLTVSVTPLAIFSASASDPTPMTGETETINMSLAPGAGEVADSWYLTADGDPLDVYGNGLPPATKSFVITEPAHASFQVIVVFRTDHGADEVDIPLTVH